MSDEGLGGYVAGLASRALTPEGIQRNSYFGKVRPGREEPALGYERPRPAQVEFYTVWYDHDDTIEVRATYRTSGPTFVAYKRLRELRFLMFSERRNVQHELEHKAFRRLCRQVESYNSVVQPIDNGPDDRVYLVETGHRVAEAVRASCEGRPDSIELQSACRANLYAADIVIANFNRNHTTTKD